MISHGINWLNYKEKIGLKYNNRRLSSVFKKHVVVIKVEDQEREGKEIKQGCSLSPLLFNI